MNPEYTLKKHQMDALNFFKDKACGALFYEMGLGKTFIMLEQLHRIGRTALPCLIVCPLSAVSVWANEVKKFGYDFKVVQLTGSAVNRAKLLLEEADIFVINYEGLRVIPQSLARKGFNCIIFDESHRAKEKGAEQTRVAVNLSSSIAYRYIMTGTPVAKSQEDIWTQFQIIAPNLLGNWWYFRNKFVEYRKIKIRTRRGLQTIQKAIKFKNKELLGNLIKEVAIRRTKAECLDLPEKIYRKVDCPLTKEQATHYWSLRASLATLLADDKQMKMMSAGGLIQKLQQVCQGFIYEGEEKNVVYFESGKLKMLKDILQDLENEKVILFAWYQADVDRLKNDLEKSGYNVILYGGSNIERQKQVDLFQNGEGPAIFLAQIEIAKESITLTAANHVIYYGNSWNYATRKQSEDRAHRIGQTKSVIYHDLVVPNTVDENIFSALAKKGEIADEVTQDTQRLAQLILSQSEENNGTNAA